MSKLSLEERRLIWAVCCLAFHGSFRIHELLSRKVGSFDGTKTLLGNDVRLVNTTIDGIQEEILIVHLKSSKEQQLSKGINVELFATGGFSCPVKAWKMWRSLARIGLSAAKPVFRLSD